jgi:Uma2 family endonuclease
MDARGDLLLSYRDYATLPADGRCYELHDGALSVTPAPGTRHQRISRNLSELLNEHVTTRGLGEVLYAPLDVILSDITVVQPDLIYLDRSRQHLASERGVEGPPALVVEILSPSTRTIDRVTKPFLYARHGIPCLWLVDPEARTIEAFVLERGSYVPAVRVSGDEEVTLPPFPDLTLCLGSLWP